jgi:CheY-like chemotaxis protein
MFRALNRILLVDDDDTTNHINHRMLTKAGVARQIDVRMQGQEALEYLMERDSIGIGDGYRAPEVIFLDLKMPVMDGFTFLDQYKNLKEEMKAKVIFILSSSASFYDLHRLKNYPYVIETLDKPLSREYVLELMAKHFPEHAISPV